MIAETPDARGYEKTNRGITGAAECGRELRGHKATTPPGAKALVELKASCFEERVHNGVLIRPECDSSARVEQGDGRSDAVAEVCFRRRTHHDSDSGRSQQFDVVRRKVRGMPAMVRGPSAPAS